MRTTNGYRGSSQRFGAVLLAAVGLGGCLRWGHVVEHKAESVIDGDDDSGDASGGDASDGDTNPGDTCAGCATDLAVVPVYPNLGNWNDYIKNNDPTRDIYHQSGIECDGTELGDYTACVHGGELRMTTFSGRTSCGGLVAGDRLDAFTWICQDSGGAGPVNFYTVGLRDTAAVGLRTLLDASGFAPNAIEIRDSTGAIVGQSQPRAWDWTNPVLSLPNNAGTGRDTLTESGTIYTVDTIQNTSGFNINADKISVVAAPGALRPVAGFGDSCNFSTGEATPINRRVLICAGSQRFIWIEGNLGAELGGDVRHGLVLVNVIQSVLRNVRVFITLDTGLYLGFSSKLSVSFSGAARTGTGPMVENSAVHLENVQLSFFRALSGADATGHGIHVTGSSNNTFIGVKAFNNQENGINVDLAATENVFSQILATNNFMGIRVAGGSSRNTFSHITSANNADDGMRLEAVTNITLVSFVGVNNDNDGLDVRGTDNLFSTLALTNNIESGVYLPAAAANNAFTGHLLVGLNNGGGVQCTVVSVTSPGLVHGTCSDDGLDNSNSYAGQSSDAILRIPIDGAASLLGKVTTTDAVNTSNFGGAQPYALVTDWHRFSNSFRTWGRDGSPFPDISNLGRCAAASCRMWDWQLRNDTGLLVGFHEPFTSNVCNDAADGNNFLTDLMTTNNTFLPIAIEITGDGYGDDDGLCESDEECIYAPNIGAYHGSGGYRGLVCSIRPGLITGVTMFRYMAIGE